MELLTQVEIPDPKTAVDRYTFEFSGGMRQRAMIAMALRSAWDRLDASAQTASNMQTNGKGAQGLLKALSGPIDIPTVLIASLPDETLAARAKAWRHLVEQALAARLGDGAKAQESAAVLFATWQGRLLWDAAGGKGFRLGEALKRLT